MNASTESTCQCSHAKQLAASVVACCCCFVVVFTAVRSNADVWTWAPTASEPQTRGYLASLGEPTYGPLIDLPTAPSAVTVVTDED